MTAAENRASSAQYLRKVEQRIMARDNLLEVIDKYKLFSDGDMSDGDKVYALRLSTRIEQVIDPGQSWRPNAAPSAMTVTVRLGDPQLVAEIANEFVQRVLDQNKQSRLLQANQTFEFFRNEEQRVGEAITSLDAQIAVFKTQNADSLPLALAAQQELLVSLEDAALQMDQEIVELNNNKSKIRKAEFEQQMNLAKDQRQLIQERIENINSAIAAGQRSNANSTALSVSLHS